MGETKRFPLGVVLTATTKRLLTEPDEDGGNGIENLYELLSWMCGESVFTHQLGRFADECAPWLYRWFPELAACGTGPAMDSLDGRLGRDRTPDKQEGIKMWLAEMKMMIPGLADEYDVPRIPADDRERKDPHDELVAMRGTDEGIVFVAMPEGGE